MEKFKLAKLKSKKLDKDMMPKYIVSNKSVFLMNILNFYIFTDFIQSIYYEITEVKICLARSFSRQRGTT